MANVDERIVFDYHPALQEEVSLLQCSDIPAVTRAVALGHLADPRRSADELAQVMNVGVADVKVAYRFLQESEVARLISDSWFYPYRMYYDYASATLTDLVASPAYFDKLLQQQPVFSRVLEIHPSRGTCDYGCVMCLWSDKKMLTYASQSLDTDGLMQVKDWERVLCEAYALGTRTVVVSGGGEVFLNSSAIDVLAIAYAIGFKIHIYTNGFSLPVDNSAALDNLLRAEQIRFSIHSPVEETYNAITSVPARRHALPRVCERITALLKARGANTTPRTGIGFVIQPHNVGEIAQMADFSIGLGVDFLNIRKDEVDVTEALSHEQLAIVKQQMNTVRNGVLNAAYGDVFIDMSDELISIANGFEIRRRRVRECITKLVRPTISPFGVLAPCDLKAEPRFAGGSFNLGQVRHSSLIQMSERMATTFIPDACQECMPSSRTSNLVYAKLLADHRVGVQLTEQPFFHPTPDSTPKEGSC